MLPLRGDPRIQVKWCSKRRANRVRAHVPGATDEGTHRGQRGALAGGAQASARSGPERRVPSRPVTERPPPADVFLTQRCDAVRDRTSRGPFARLARRLDHAVGVLVADSGVGPGETVIDLGCETKPYAHHFRPGVRYIGADLPGNPDADVPIGPDGRVPLDDGTADLVLSTQVLEHVPDPAAYLDECFRLLRPGGALALTTHGMMYLHRDPQDLWRWTTDGLVRIVEDAGFEVLDTVGVFGLVATGLQLTLVGLLRRSPGPAHRPLVGLLGRLIRLADRDPEQRGRDDGLVIGVRARRPPTG